MNKIRAGAVALGLVSAAAVTTPAAAQYYNQYGQQYNQYGQQYDRNYERPRSGFSIQIITRPPRYNYDYPNYSYQRDNRYRNDRFLSYRYFSRLPSYYPGRCNYTDVVVRDPYTQRIVCMPRYDYQRYTYEYRNRY